MHAGGQGFEPLILHERRVKIQESRFKKQESRFKKQESELIKNIRKAAAGRKKARIRNYDS